MWTLSSVEAEAGQTKLSVQERLEDLQQEMASLREDVDDLQGPVEESDLFDQCVFTIGVTKCGKRDGTPGTSTANAASSGGRPWTCAGLTPRNKI